MLLVQCVCGKGDGPSWNRGVNFASIAHLHLSTGLQMRVSVNLLLCVHVVCRLFIPTNTGGQCSVFVLLDGEL